jgi:putative oxidoreductase
MNGESMIRKGVNSTLYGNRLTAAIRLAMGLLLVFSGALKLPDPGQFAQVIARYDIIPVDLAPYAAGFMPVLETILGLLLVVGYRVRAAALISMAMMLAFGVFIAINVARGRTFDCGCFEVSRLGIEFGETVSVWLVVRDLIFAAGFAIVARAQRHLFSLEYLVERTRLKNLEKSKYE